MGKILWDTRDILSVFQGNSFLPGVHAGSAQNRSAQNAARVGSDRILVLMRPQV